MRRSLFLILLLLLFILPALAKNVWLTQIAQIKPLVSTEQDVERILGKPAESYADMAEFETNEGVFTVTYSRGRCDQARMVPYNVDKDIVLGFDFSPKIKILFSSLKININGLRKEITDDVDPVTITYFDPGKGISYSVHGKWIDLIDVYPADSFAYLECQKIDP